MMYTGRQACSPSWPGGIPRTAGVITAGPPFPLDKVGEITYSLNGAPLPGTPRR